MKEDVDNYAIGTLNDIYLLNFRYGACFEQGDP